MRKWAHAGIVAMSLCIGLGWAYGAGPGQADQHSPGQQGQAIQQTQPGTGALNTGSDLTGGRDKHLGPQGGAELGNNKPLGHEAGKNRDRKRGRHSAIKPGAEAGESTHSTLKQDPEKLTSGDKVQSGLQPSGETSGKLSQDSVHGQSVSNMQGGVSTDKTSKGGTLQEQSAVRK